MRLRLFLILVILALSSVCFSQEERITITTYYPAPYGSYRELTSHRMKIGVNYSGAGTTVADNNLIVEGSVGIGTPSPNAALTVQGAISRGGSVNCATQVNLGIGSATAQWYSTVSGGYNNTASGGFLGRRRAGKS